MAKPSETPQIFCTQANYSTLTARSSRNGTPTKVDAGNAWRNEGAKPAEGSPAQAFNFEANIWSKYVRWVWEGKNTPTADAHIVETNSVGKAAVRSADIGVAGVVPAGNAVLEVRGATAGKFGALFDFTGKSTTNAAIQFYASQRTVATFDCAESGNDHSYGFYPGVIGRFKGHGFVAHERGLTGAQVKADLGVKRGMFVGHSTGGVNDFAFLGVGEAGLVELRRKADTTTNQRSVPTMNIVNGTGAGGRVLNIIQSAPPRNTSTQHAVNIDVVSGGTDAAPRTPLFVNSARCEGSTFIGSNPRWSGASGASYGAGAWLKQDGSDPIGQGSAGIFAVRNTAGGSAFRAVEGNPTGNLFPVSTAMQTVDVRLIDEGGQHLAMSFSPAASASTFNPGQRLGISAHKRSGNTPLLQVRRGSAGEGFEPESVMTYQSRPIHFIASTLGGQAATAWSAGTLTLQTISSNSSNGPTPPMPYPTGAQLFFRAHASGSATVNARYTLTLIIRDNTTNQVVHSSPMGVFRRGNGNNTFDAHFSHVTTAKYNFGPGGAGHRSFSLQLNVVEAGGQGQAAGVVTDCSLEIICLNSVDGD